MKKTIRKVIFLIVISVVVAVFSLSKIEKIATYVTTEVKKGNIESIISSKGILAATKEQKEYSKFSAEVEEIFYLEGDKVEVGYPIMKLDSSSCESMIKTQEIAIKQAELSIANIERQINDLKIVAENDGYVSELEVIEGSYVTATMAVCNIVKDGKFEIVLQFPYYEKNPVVVGTMANVTFTDSFGVMQGTVTKVSDMRKIIEGNAQVVDVTIEVETTGYSLDGANAKAEVSNGVTILQSANVSKFTSINSNIIRARVAGTIKEVYVNEGKRIKAGDIIAVLENPDLETSLENANLTLENLNNQLDMMKKNLEDYTIYAKIPGIITMQNAIEGDMISIGTLLTSIADKETMEFVVPINELDIAKLDYGKEVRVMIDALIETKNNPLVGKIIDIPHEGVSDNNVVNYYVTIQVPGSDKMKISMNANADIVIESKKDVVCVPIDAIVKENTKSYVDVLLTDGITIERREVITGISDAVNIEIKSGLEEGEKVIIQ